MLDKIRKCYAYANRVNTKISESIRVFSMRAFIQRCAKKLAELANQYKLGIAALSAVIIWTHYVDPASDISIVIRQIRLNVEANIITLIVIFILIISFRQTWGTLRAVTLHMNLGRMIYIGWFIFSFGLILAMLSGWLYIPNHPYYFFYTAVCGYILVATGLLRSVTSKKYIVKVGTLEEDSPQTDTNQFGPYQLSALENLKQILTEQQRIRSIGLYGDWGSGKTSIYEAAKEEISQVDGNIIWQEIEPWRYTSQESLVLGFYHEIGAALEKAIPGSQNTTNNLIKLAEPLVKKHDSTGILESAYQYMSNITSKENGNPAKYISNLLDKEGKYLIVAIDNIERSYDTEHIYRTLQLVHFLRGHNISYIFISEKTRLLELMSQISDKSNVSEVNDKIDAAVYLEKFIEYEIDVFSPTTDQLKTFLSKKLLSHSISTENMTVSNSMLKSIGTYRGIIKVVNFFVIGLDDRFKRNGYFTINLGDKLQLDYLRSKYPLIWKHIERNRDLYDEGMRDYDTLTYFSQSEGDQVRNRSEKLKALIDENVSKKDQTQIEEILGNLFPILREVFGGGQVARNYSEWRANKRVCIPNILDDYFARSEDLKSYNDLLDEVSSIIEQHAPLKKSTNTQAARHIRSFIRLARNRADVRDSVRLLLSEILRADLNKSEKRKFIRFMLRLYAGYSTTANLDDEKVIGGMLVTINELETGLIDKARTLKNDLNYIFTGIWNYSENPSFVLRLLLQLNPRRENDLYNLKNWGDNTTGYEYFKKHLLSKIDEFYADETNFNNIFANVESREWSFIYHQWSRSVHIGDYVPTRTEMHRFKQVNQKFQDSFRSKPELGYECLRLLFNLSRGSGRKVWTIPFNSKNNYDLHMLKDTIDSLTSSPSLSSRKKANLQKLLPELNSQIESQQKAEALRSLVKVR